VKLENILIKIKKNKSKNIMNIDKDTIVAISTANGFGAISIIRLSGEQAIKISKKIFKPFKNKVDFSKTHVLHYGYIQNHKGEIIDEVLLSVMHKPKTYTVEDIVEINCHGSNSCIKQILDICIKNGARLAYPGEFTKRAFLNGRIDLSQAEAVLDIINSETDLNRKNSINQLFGIFSKEINKIKEQILDILTNIELAIDFSEEDVDFVSMTDIREKINNIMLFIEKTLKHAEKDKLLKQGLKIVLTGKPNVGKSSIMNALLKEDRVIVSSIPGTTRDIVEDFYEISGIKIILSDTAGIIDTKDQIEKQGIKKSKKKIENADIILFIIDASCEFSVLDEKIYNLIKNKNIIIIINKIDIVNKKYLNNIKSRFSKYKLIEISALKHYGLDLIEDEIKKQINKETKVVNTEDFIITNMRHKIILNQILKHIKEAKQNIEKNNIELLSNDLRDIIYQLGLILGESIDIDVLDKIFSQFCIGK